MPNPEDRSGGDAMENAQRRMLARIERMDVEKRLERLERDQRPSVEECRKLLELAN